MGSTQVPRVEIDLGDDIFSYANMLNGSSQHTDNIFPTFGYRASGDGTGYSQSPIQSQAGVQSEPNTTKRAKRAKDFSIQEDNLLVSAWLNTSLDPIIGNDQKGDAYWKRIWEYFYSEKTFELECDRNKNSLMNCWSGIQLDVNKFCGIYAGVERIGASGTTEQDRILEAKQKFKMERKYNFAYEHCWNLLKHHPKWNLELSRKKPKKTHGMTHATPSVSQDIEDLDGHGDSQNNDALGLVRPMGKKAAKTLVKNAKAKEKVGAAPSELGDYYALKLEHAHKEDEQFQLMYDAEQENIKLRKQELEIQVRKEDNTIMAIDTSTMEEFRAEYFKGLQREIIAKRAAEGH